jgi:hypothetical protein
MADAAERITSRRRKREKEQAAAVEWLKTKRDEVGLMALAKMLGADAANLQKVIEGERKCPAAMLAEVGSIVERGSSSLYMN